MRNADQVVVAFHPNRTGQDRKQESVLGCCSAARQDPSPAATQIRAQVRRIAPYFHLASLTGSPCCGEEQVARALHRWIATIATARSVCVVCRKAAEERFATSKLQPVVDGFLYLSEAEHLSASGADRPVAAVTGARQAARCGWSLTQGRGLRPLLSAGLFNAELAGICLVRCRLRCRPCSERKG